MPLIAVAISLIEMSSVRAFKDSLTQRRSILSIYVNSEGHQQQNTQTRETKTGRCRGPEAFSPLLEFALSRTRLIDGRPCPSAGDHLRAASCAARASARGAHDAAPPDRCPNKSRSFARSSAILSRECRVHAHSKFRSSPHRER